MIDTVTLATRWEEAKTNTTTPQVEQDHDFNNVEDCLKVDDENVVSPQRRVFEKLVYSKQKEECALQKLGWYRYSPADDIRKLAKNIRKHFIKLYRDRRKREAEQGLWMR